MYPRTDILQISVILTDTDRIWIVISLFERIWVRIWILCHGHSTDIHYVCILFHVLFLLLFSIVNIRHSRHRHHGLQVIEYPVYQYYDKSVVTGES